MDFGDFEKRKLFADEFRSSSSTILNLCRICHEEEDEKTSKMESPCSCSGTLKFAHRKCIQRWCNEKGNNVCEICLQKFEPAYHFTHPSPFKHCSFSTVITIRSSLEEQEHNHESDVEQGEERTEPSTNSFGCASCFRFLILMITIILLLRNLSMVLSNGADDYAFSLTTVCVFTLRTIGILLPFCFVMRLFTTVRNAQRHHYYDNVVPGFLEEADVFMLQ